MPTYKQKKQRLKQLVKAEQQERIKKIQQKGYDFKKGDAFRAAQKHYKSYVHIKTDYSKVIDPNKLKYFQIQGFKVLQIPSPQGAFLIKNFIDLKTQYELGFQALNDFIRKPYRNNLDGTNGLYFNEKGEKQKQNKDLNEQKQQQKQKQENIKEIQDFQEKNQNKQYFFNQKIRMANLGYQYDWPHRSYPKTQVPIPTSVKNLTSKAKQIYKKIKKIEDIEYYGEAVIVNYYKQRDYMIGHLDDGQQDQINPIFSFCFGLSCIFLLGFPQKQLQPIALKLDAGDLLIMSGYSRICYHGVPRIIEDSYQTPQQNNETEYIRNLIDSNRDNKMRLNGFREINNFFKNHRLNINVRQVWIYKNIKQQIRQNSKFQNEY